MPMATSIPITRMTATPNIFLRTAPAFLAVYHGYTHVFGPPIGPDAGSADFLFVDMHVDSRTFRQWLTNADELWGVP